METDFFAQANRLRAEHETAKQRALDYGAWIIQNCIVTQTGFRSALVNMWTKEISNEKAYELYLESLKSK